MEDRKTQHPATNKKKEGMKALALPKQMPPLSSYLLLEASIIAYKKRKKKKKNLHFRAGSTGDSLPALASPPCMTLDQSLGLSRLVSQSTEMEREITF